MSKRYYFWSMILNGFFVITNAILLYGGSAPTVNFLAALVCLGCTLFFFNNWINYHDKDSV